MSDSFPADDLPLLAPDRAQIETWLRVLSVTSELLRAARMDMKLEAFSEAEQAALAHDEVVRRALSPGVRPMTDAENRHWTDEAASRAEQQRMTDDGHELAVRIGPLPDGRWAMDATVTPPTTPGDTGPAAPATSVAVSCPTEHHARELADEVLSAGPDAATLDRLARHAARRGASDADASSQVREPEHLRLARTRDAIRQAWSPALAERVIASEAFGTLAARLHQLEERGATLPDVLARMSQTALLEPTVRDPARVAGWMCENRLTVIEGQVVSTGRQTSQSRPDRAGVDKVAMADMVRDALPDQVATQILACPAWPALAKTMAHHHSTAAPGAPSTTQLLADLPIAAIGRARKPAAYAAKLLHERMTADQQISTSSAVHPPSPAEPPNPSRTADQRADSDTHLDPASAIDRITLDATSPYSLPRTDRGAVAAHQQAADDAAREADRDERGAGYERTLAEHTDLAPTALHPGEAGLDAEGAARIDDNLAAGYRAAAAEELGAANAAAIRAQVVLTPPTSGIIRPSSPVVASPAPARGLLRTRQNTPTADQHRAR